MRNEHEPRPHPDIDVTVRPFEHGLVLGRHPDGGTTIFVRGELSIRVAPPIEPATTPEEQWVFPTLAVHGPEEDAGKLADLARDLGEEPPVEVVAPEPAPLRFQVLELGSEGPVTVFKCFVPEEDEDGEDGEFYLRLNRETGEGELSLSDPAFAPRLVELFRRAMAVPVDHEERP